MDDQKRQYLSRPQSPQPAPEQPVASPNLEKPRNLVLQPSAELVQDVQAEQAKKAAELQIQPQPDNTPKTAFVSDQPKPQSIYPEATNGIAGTAPPKSASSPSISAAEAEVAELARYNSGKVRTVRIVAGVLILLNLIYLYNWFLLGAVGFLSIIPLAIVGFYLCLLVGIFRLKELARLIYVILAIISLFFATVGFIQTFLTNTATPRSAVSTTTITQEEQQSDERTIANYKKIKNPTPYQKAAEDNIENNLRNLNSKTSSASAIAHEVERDVSETLSIALAIGPLIILTRPSIKSVFS